MSKKQQSDGDGEVGKVVGLEALGFHLDGASWMALEERHPALARVIKDLVDAGYSPQEIRQYTMQRGVPVQQARWLEQSARFLAAGGGSE